MDIPSDFNFEDHCTVLKELMESEEGETEEVKKMNRVALTYLSGLVKDIVDSIDKG